MGKYTLDRIEDNVYVFLEYPDEVNQLLLPVAEYAGELVEGAIVKITTFEGDTLIEVLEEERNEQLNKVSELLKKLKNKNKS